MLLLLSACDSDEPTAAGDIDAENADGKISFAVTDPSRAVTSFNATTPPDYFKVWATMDLNGETIMYMNGDALKKGSDGKYDYIDNVCYWPLDNDPLNFYAVTDRKYGDYGTRTPFGSGGEPNLYLTSDGITTSYSVSANSDSQGDLIYAVTPNQTYSENPVELSFKHALSRISFKIRSEYSEYADVYLRKIVMNGPIGDGECVFSNDDCEWTPDTYSTNRNFTIEFPDEGFLFNKLDGMVSVGTDQTKSCFMMIPQQLEKITVTATIAFKAKDNGVSETILPELSSDRTFTATIQNINWEAGKSYSYSITLSAPDHFDINGHEAVLMKRTPTPLYMATENIKNSADEYLFFWWGDTVGHVNDNSFKFLPTNNDILTNGMGRDQYSEFAIVTSGSETNPNVIQLKPEYDAATKKWGGAWHCPTLKELFDLFPSTSFAARLSCTRVYNKSGHENPPYTLVLLSLDTYDYVEFIYEPCYIPNVFPKPNYWLLGSSASWVNFGSTPDYEPRDLTMKLNPSVVYGNMSYGLQVRPVASPTETPPVWNK